MTNRYPPLGIALWVLCTLICLIPPVAYVLGFGGYLNGTVVLEWWEFLPWLQMASAVALAILAYLDRPPTSSRPWLGPWLGRAAGVLYGAGMIPYPWWWWWPSGFERFSFLLGGAVLYGFWTVSMRMPPRGWQRWAVYLLAPIAFAGVLFGKLTSQMY